MSHLYKILTSVMLVLSFHSCTNFLNVEKDLASELQEEDIFGIKSNLEKFHRNLYVGIPDLVRIYANDLTGFHNPWMFASDEVICTHNTFNQWNIGHDYTSSGGVASTYGRWKSCYQYIRQANLFLEKARTIDELGNPDLSLNEKDLQKLKAQAYFFRAFYHYLLFEMYGAIPIIDYAIDPGQSDLDFGQNTLDEVITFIDGELTKLIDGSDGYTGLEEIETSENSLSIPSKMVARALRAMLWVYAASPLYNGGYEEALELINMEGKRLYPDYDAGKWTISKNKMEDFLNNAQGKYDLVRVYKDGKIDADLSTYSVFQSYNEEIIWARSNATWGTLAAGGSPSNGYDSRITPVSEGNNWPNMSPTQELVDDFFMLDGLSTYSTPAFPKSDLYPDADPTITGSFGFSVDGEDLSVQKMEAGNYRMWINREPRFYNAVFTHGRKWHNNGNKITQFHNGSPNGSNQGNYPRTGYLLHKKYPRELLATSAGPRTKYRPNIVFRLADFYLLYAEILNEVNPNDPKIFQYIDFIRERAGIPTLEELQSTGEINIRGDYLKQKEAIERERRIELCTEGQRYWDLRRLMMADKPSLNPLKNGEGPLEGYMRGMNMFGTRNVESEFFQVINVRDRHWKKAKYLWPIDLNQVTNSEKLVQNPFWD